MHRPDARVGADEARDAATPAGPRDPVTDALTEMVAAARRAERLVCGTTGEWSLDDWLAVVGGCQAVVNRLVAVQDVAIARSARIEVVVDEDGTRGSHRHGPGRVVLGAADAVAPRLGASHHQAQNRVERAVRLTGREPVEAGTDALPDRTGLDALHRAMRDGRLDAYRAEVVADELEGCPAEVATAVVAALQPHLDDEPASGLRQRTRRVLGRISPDLLRERATRARAETGLRRWVAEPGVDEWRGRFPSEESARAWAAVDGLARRYVLEGVCAGIEQARGRALTDLVTQSATVDVQLLLTVPADHYPGTGADASPRVADGSGAVGGPTSAADLDGPTSGADLEGPTSAADVDVSAPVSTAGADASGSAHGRVADDRSQDLVQVHGSRPSEPILVRRGWLDRYATPVAVAVCDGRTGARLDVGDELASGAYRPPDRLADLVRSRDGRCRFPGCSVSARFCDLDHAVPWPTGRTSARTLLCLCRRHHRIKQTPGWWLRLRPDATAEWTDPTGRIARTEPRDALEGLTLRAAPAPPEHRSPPDGSTRSGLLPSVLEERLEHRLDHQRAHLRRRRGTEPAFHAHHRPRAPAWDGGPPPF